MIGKVQMDSFLGLGIRTPGDFGAADSVGYEPLASPLACHHDKGEPFLLKECPVVVGSGRPSSRLTAGCSSPVSRPLTPNSCQQQQQSSSRYKTEMCRPFQEHGVCKYGEKCQFAHGDHELRSVQRHPKYKTDMCRTYHTVGFCPYGPRCHFIHSLEEMRLQNSLINGGANSPDKRNGAGNGIKQLPMFGGAGKSDDGWSSSSFSSSFDSFSNDSFNSFNSGNSHNNNNMKTAVAQLNKYFNMTGSSSVGNSGPGNNFGAFSLDTSSRSGSFSSDGESVSSHSPSSASPPPDSLCTSPIDVSRSLRLPIFNRLA